jgi:hypothetical protein
MNLAKLVIGFLNERSEQKFTARQIADWIFATYPEECQEKRSNSRGDYIKTDADLVQQLIAEIGSQRPRLQKKYPELKTTEGRPRKYYYSEKTDTAEVAAAGVVSGICRHAIESAYMASISFGHTPRFMHRG